MNYSRFKSHLLRHPKNVTLSSQKSSNKSKLSCSNCKETFLNQFLLIQHLNTHLKRNESINCPISPCAHLFSNSSTFRSHMLRKHNSSSVIRNTQISFHENLNENHELDMSEDIISSSSSADIILSERIFINEEECTTTTADNQILKNYGDSLLTLSTRHFVSNDTIQFIVDSNRQFISLYGNVLQEKVKENLLSKN